DRSAGGVGNVGPVVDRPELAGGIGDLGQHLQEPQLVARFQTLFPELDDVHSTGICRREKVAKVTLALPGIGAQIEPGLRELGPRQGDVDHGSRRYPIPSRIDHGVLLPAHGSPVDWAERAAGSRRPSNLIRVMPAQGANSSQFPAAHLVILHGRERLGGVMAKSDVIIVGGGVIGLATAWRTAQRGHSVTVVDPKPGGAASHTAAGMLAPVTELHYEGRDLLALNLESARRYPGFAAELRDATGLDVGYRECGTVQAAWDAADLADRRALQAFQESLGVRSEMLTSRELRTVEPALAAGLPGGLFAVGDHQVDNRALVTALMSAAEAAGVTVIRRSV